MLEHVLRVLLRLVLPLLGVLLKVDPPAEESAALPRSQVALQRDHPQGTALLPRETTEESACARTELQAQAELAP